MVGVTGSIPVAPTTFSLICSIFWHHPRADLAQMIDGQSHVNRKQASLAALSEQRHDAVDRKRNVHQREWIGLLIVVGGARAVANNMPEPKRALLARDPAKQALDLIGHEVAEAVLGKARDA